jgi:hypothetical protein
MKKFSASFKLKNATFLSNDSNMGNERNKENASFSE